MEATSESKTMKKRIAMAGASGVGKTTLSKWLATTLNVEMNPVGARSVAASMGFLSPYDVDAAGRRSEFQRRTCAAKLEWENGRDSFVTDRTTLDNLAYTILHDHNAVDEAMWRDTLAGLARLTHVVYCPLAAFQNLGDDPARPNDPVYHRVFDALLFGLLLRHRPDMIVLDTADLEQRKAILTAALGLPGR